MRITILVLLAVAVWSCGGPRNGGEGAEAGLMQAFDGFSYPRNSKDEINLHEARRIIEKNKFKAEIVSADFGVYKRFMARLNKQSLYSITTAADYTATYLSKTSDRFKDSTYVYFSKLFREVSTNKSDSLYDQFPDIIKKIARGEPDQDTEALEFYFDLFGMDLISEEGGQMRLEAEPDYFLKLFGNHVSKPLNEFLNLRYVEVDKGFSQNAKLVITFNEVYDRAVKWEDYMQNYPKSVVTEDAQLYFNTYLETLLTGLDNTRIYDEETGVILPEIREIYETIIKSGEKRKSTEIIKGFYDLLKANGFKYSAALDTYLNEHGLHTMLGRMKYFR